MNPVVSVLIVNESTNPAIPATIPIIVSALAKQLALEVSPVWWSRAMPAIAWAAPSEKSVLADASQIVLLDDSDQADALGYHAETPDGLPYAKVFVNPILANGGTLTVGSNSLSVTISHELIEMIGDASANTWAENSDGVEYAIELCDAVESDSYAIDGVSVSNFVYPAFFDPEPEAGSKFDYLGVLTAPFSTAAGGYQVTIATTGEVKQIFGARYPEWRKALKSHPASRNSKRAKYTKRTRTWS